MTPGPGSNSSDNPKTYKHTRPDGTTVRVTVPDDPKPEEMLIDSIRDNLSPHAVALIAAKLQVSYCGGKRNDEMIAAEQQCQWFTARLIEMLGNNQFNQLCEELGV
jgi:hypothetical protein